MGAFKTILKYEIYFAVKSVRYLTFLFLAFLSFLLHNLVYYKLCERDRLISKLPNFSKNSFENIYRAVAAKIFSSHRELLGNVLDADPFLVISFYLLIALGPLLLILLAFPAISDEIQGKTINCFILYTGRLRFYAGKTISHAVISVPVLTVLVLISYIFNGNRLIPVDLADQVPLALRYALLTGLYLCSIISLIVMASSLTSTSYGSLGLSIALYIFFLIAASSSYGFVSPLYYGTWIFYNSPVLIAQLAGILVIFILVFNSISLLVMHRKSLT